MLKSILSKDFPLKIMTISDTAVIPSEVIFNAVVNSVISNAKGSVHIVCTELSKQLCRSKFSNKGSNIKYIDACSMPKSPFQTTSIEDLFDRNDLSSSDVVIFDSINYFLWDQPIHKLSQQLVDLSQRVEKIILRVHIDVLLNKNDVVQLQHISRQCCHIEMVEKKPAGYIVRVTQSKPLKRQLEFCTVGETGGIHSELYSEKIPVVPARIVPMNTLTTFDLGVKLSQSEKEARDRLVLPYLRTREEIGAKIDYEADEGDLEEDPDEDLEL